MLHVTLCPFGEAQMALGGGPAVPAAEHFPRVSACPEGGMLLAPVGILQVYSGKFVVEVDLGPEFGGVVLRPWHRSARG